MISYLLHVPKIGRCLWHLCIALQCHFSIFMRHLCRFRFDPFPQLKQAHPIEVKIGVVLSFLFEAIEVIKKKLLKSEASKSEKAYQNQLKLVRGSTIGESDLLKIFLADMGMTECRIMSRLRIK